MTAADDCGSGVADDQRTVVVSTTAPSLSVTAADYTTDLDADCNMTGAGCRRAATANGEDGCDSDVTIEISSEDGAIAHMAVNVDDVAEGGYHRGPTATATMTVATAHLRPRQLITATT